ncbi:hypothetical protein GCM10007886_20550 [Methylobacterium gregans]|nr:hypothetical protein GCM10007886_20550 [Methylobacterium gregans]
MRASLPLPSARLLKKAQAAAYCGISASAFTRTCPVTPISMAPPGRQDERLLRYDVRDLDRWIDGLAEGSETDDELLARLG